MHVELERFMKTLGTVQFDGHGLVFVCVGHRRVPLHYFFFSFTNEAKHVHSKVERSAKTVPKVNCQ